MIKLMYIFGCQLIRKTIKEEYYLRYKYFLALFRL
jgi:hypothetical protein